MSCILRWLALTDWLADWLAWMLTKYTSIHMTIDLMHMCILYSPLSLLRTTYIMHIRDYRFFFIVHMDICTLYVIHGHGHDTMDYLFICVCVCRVCVQKTTRYTTEYDAIEFMYYRYVR